jgi:murein DD-endopeptidase MepM/ murein hydrolase activator NlpD
MFKGLGRRTKAQKMQSPREVSPGDRIVLDCGARSYAVRLPRFGVAAVAAVSFLVIGWSLTAGAYILFHDAVVAELRRGASAARQGYEAQIADMTEEAERQRTRRLVERAGLDQRLAEIARKQEILERRQSVLTELADPALVPAPRVVTSGEPAEASLGYAAKPTPLELPVGGPSDPLDAVEDAAPAGAAHRTEKTSSALDRLEARQTLALEAIDRRTEERRRKLENVYSLVGVKPSGGRGGPFIPLSEQTGSLADPSFDEQAERVAAARGAVAALRRDLDLVPLRVPISGAAITSGFGVRSDPFLRTAAFHAGLDFEGGMGQPARATAPGRIVSAGWSGGYGLMVEVDHGRGLSTRYGHLSSILVSPGQTVGIGATLGLIGSTGRSTGPHLHYETRVNGEATDPLRFLRAGRTLSQID